MQRYISLVRTLRRKVFKVGTRNPPPHPLFGLFSVYVRNGAQLGIYCHWLLVLAVSDIWWAERLQLCRLFSFFEILKPFFHFFIAVFMVVIHVIMMVIVITHFGYLFSCKLRSPYLPINERSKIVLCLTALKIKNNLYIRTWINVTLTVHCNLRWKWSLENRPKTSVKSQLLVIMKYPFKNCLHE
jgi:hypothetical protein